ncbi:MAG: hypothetical protein C4K58_00630 [Flavobacteriaceae bacterium]|nr:MAG: hypothetical protein C4K58_00630 [Flavobacteriaceae bacterium]
MHEADGHRANQCKTLNQVQRIEKLDGLRGIFSLLVVFYHLPSTYFGHQVFQNFFFKTSYCFVDFFFVLSGFVLSYRYDSFKNTSSIVDFVKKRFIRLFPLLAFSSIVYFLYEIVLQTLMPGLFPKNFIPQADFSISSSFLSLIDTLFFANSTPLFGDSMGMNYPSWSISSEMISYLIFALFGVLFKGFSKKLLQFALVIGSLLFLYSLGNYFQTGSFGFVRGIVGFFSGCLLFSVGKTDFKIPNFFQWLILPFLMLFVYEIHGIPKDEWNFLNHLSVPMFFSGLIFLILHSQGIVSAFLETKPIQYLGKISYSVYLNHALILGILPKGISLIFNPLGSLFSQLVLISIILMILILYSHFTFNWIEIKTANFLKKKILH